MTELLRIFNERDLPIIRFDPDEREEKGTIKWVKFPIEDIGLAAGVIIVEPDDTKPDHTIYDYLTAHGHEDENHGEFYVGFGGSICVPKEVPESPTFDVTQEVLSEGEVGLIPPKSVHGVVARQRARVGWTFQGEFDVIANDYDFDPSQEFTETISILKPSDRYGESIVVADKLPNLSASFIRVAPGYSHLLPPIDCGQLLSIVGEGHANMTATGAVGLNVQSGGMAIEDHSAILPQARVEIFNTGTQPLLMARQMPSGRFPQPGMPM